MTKKKLRQKSIIQSFSSVKAELTSADIENIISNEYVRTYQDLLERRIGIRNAGQWIYQKSLKQLLEEVPKELTKDLR